MRSALFPLSIQGGCCRSREPTVWNRLIAGSVFARRASRIDPVTLNVKRLGHEPERLQIFPPRNPYNSARRAVGYPLGLAREPRGFNNVREEP